MHNQKKVLTDYRSMLSLTSLTAAEFFELLEPFDELWQRYHAHYDLKGERRRIKKFAEHGSISLKGSMDKLFFVVVYLKQNPLQHYQRLCFGMSQGKEPVAYLSWSKRCTAYSICPAASPTTST